MNEISFPTQSTKTLVRASIIALVTASIIFVTIILPSEYKIDPTGLGKMMGLTVLAEESVVAEKTELDVDAQASQTSQAGQPQSMPYRDDRATVTIPPKIGRAHV